VSRADRPSARSANRTMSPDGTSEALLGPTSATGWPSLGRSRDHRPFPQAGLEIHAVPMDSIGQWCQRYSRWMYRSGRPNWLARPQNRLSSVVFGAGLMPRRAASLEVIGRRSGKPITLPVAIADLEGVEYLVSMLGDGANWVKNVRAAGGVAILRRGRAEPVRLHEVAIEDRPPIIRRYAAVAPGGRPHLQLSRNASIEQCEALAPRTPVFRILRLTASGRGSDTDPTYHAGSDG